MTDLNATAAAAPTFPPGRYGRRREPRRSRPGLVILLAALVAVACGAVGYRLYQIYGNPQYRPQILAETERTDERVTIRFEVRSRAGSPPAKCHVRARARDGRVVGAADVDVPARRRVVQTYTLATSARTFVVDIPRCRPAAE